MTAKIPNLHWSQWLSVLGLGLLFVALRWNNYDAPLGRDEGEYSYAARLLIQGVAPYQHAYIQKPPGVFYSYALSDLFLPQVFWSPRLLAYLFIALATVVLGWIARLEFGEGFALPVMWLATPMFLLPRLDLHDANVETFMLLPLIGTLAVYCYSRQHGNKDSHWLAAGFLAAVTLLFKYTALPILAFVFAAWIIELWQNGVKLKAIFRALMFAAIGGIVAGVLELGFFLMTGTIKDFWECTVVFNRYYAVSSGFGPGIFWSQCMFYWKNWWVLFLIPWAALLQPRLRLWFWVGTFFCALVATNGSYYEHYYLPMIPFWTLLSAVGIRTICSRIRGWMVEPSQWVELLIMAIVLLLVLLPDLSWMFYSRGQFAEKKTEGLPFIDAQVVAEEVAQMSSPNDYVYVAGSEPEILCQAQRFSPTRFITSYALMIPTPLAYGYQLEAIHELQENPPKLVVFPQSGTSWMRQSGSPTNFINFIGVFLRQDYDVAGGYVKTGPQSGYWTTTLNRDEFMNSSFWVYRRKFEIDQGK